LSRKIQQFFGWLTIGWNNLLVKKYGMGIKILFTRHGESEANVRRTISNRDLPHRLTTVGISQSLALAEALTKWNVNSVIASPILRAKETGSIIAEELGVPLSISSALREFDCGMLEGRSDEDAWIAHEAVTRAWDEDQDYDCRIMPDGESFNDMKTRFLPFLTNIIEEKNQQSDIILVSHGGMLHQMLPLVLANVDRTFTKHHPLGNCELVVTKPQRAKLVCKEWAGVKLM
jgi:broad specificity phosphatase PhoE